jgi:hypothetical protein
MEARSVNALAFLSSPFDASPNRSSARTVSFPEHDELLNSIADTNLVEYVLPFFQIIISRRSQLILFSLLPCLLHQLPLAQTLQPHPP